MGLTYNDLDTYLLEGAAPAAVAARIDRMHQASGHKRQTPPIAPVAWPTGA